MEKIILDASVVVKWFTQEEGSEKALAYLLEYKNGTISIFVPTLLFYELGNILLNKKVTATQVNTITQHLQALRLTMVDVGYEAFRKVFQNAKEYGITFYDAAYITLMQRENCKLITADKKLYTKLSKKFSFIKLL